MTPGTRPVRWKVSREGRMLDDDLEKAFEEPYFGLCEGLSACQPAGHVDVPNGRNCPLMFHARIHFSA